MNWLDKVRTKVSEIVSPAPRPAPPPRFISGHGVVQSPFGAQGFWMNWPNQDPFVVGDAEFDYTTSSLVMSAVNWLARQMGQPPPELQKIGGDQWETVPESDFLDLLARPNQYFAGENLFWAFAYDWLTQGNVYWLKARDARGSVVELWPLPAAKVSPVSVGDDFVTYYEYRPDQAREERYLQADIIHFRYGTDPADPRLGLAPIRAVLDDLLADREAARYTRYMLQHRGGVPFAVCPRGDGTLPSSIDAASLKAEIVAAFAGAGAFQPLVINRPVDFHDFVHSPADLNVAGTRQTSEARFCSVIGISPMVLDLQVGLEHSTYSNKESALRAAWTDLVVPTMNYVAGELREQLLGEFYPETEDLWVAFDYSEVKAMGEDETALYQRITLGYEKGWLKRSEARAQANYQSEAEDEIYRPAPEPSGFGFSHFPVPERKAMDTWDDAEIARYYREMAPEKYDGLITAEAK